MVVKKPLTKEMLSNLHFNQYLTIGKIAQKTGYHPETIRRKFRKWNISWLTRKQLEVLKIGRKLLHKPNASLEEILYEFYWKKKKSTRKLANKLLVSKSAIGSWMRNLSIPRRSRSEALSKHKKVPFSKNLSEKWYLRCFCTGDTTVTRHRKQIKVMSSTTHPAFLALFKQLFSTSHVFLYPKKSGNGKYSWVITAHLDSSFSFLLRKVKKLPQRVLLIDKLFYSSLAGYVDAEGFITIYHDKKSGRAYARLGVGTKKDIHLLESFCKGLELRKFHIVKTTSKDGTKKFYLGRSNELKYLLSLLPLRHGEMIAKRKLALECIGQPWEKVKERVISLRNEIKCQRDYCIKNAELHYLRTHPRKRS